MEASLKRLNLLKQHLTPNQTEGSQGKMHCEIKEDIRVAILTWDFPQTLNALSKETLTPLIEKLDEFETDERIGCVIVTGSGNAFCAGANIAGFQDDFNFTGAVKFKRSLMKNWSPITGFSKPIICAINGYCFGGGLEFAMMCDILIASELAMFGLPEIKLGLIPGAGGTQQLIRNVGKSKAMEMILTGNPIMADEAKDLHLVSRVVPHDQLMPETIKLAKKVSKMSLPSVASAKKAVRYAYESSLTQGNEYETAMFNSLSGTQDAVEGVAAFLSKRKPKWQHK
jgi:enoyl-CoA hydratase